jgi:hypothetical protein
MTTLRLDPALPVLWRDAETVQFGIDAALTLPVEGSWLPRLLHRLSLGIPARAFEVVAHGLGAPLPAARRLRTLLDPLLVADAPRAAVRLLAAPVVGARCLLRMEEARDDAGVDVVDDPAAPALLIRHGAVPARDSAALLSEDRPHLPIAFDAGGATVGPLVEPGRTPCLSCRDAHDRDRDPAWAALHVQLLERDPGRVPLAGIAAAAAAVGDLLSGRADAARAGSGLRIRISRDGRRSSQTVEFHADCRCRSPRGTARVAVLRDPHPATTSSSAFARPA